jgi:hypothetical protein
MLRRRIVNLDKIKDVDGKFKTFHVEECKCKKRGRPVNHGPHYVPDREERNNRA